MIYIDIPMPKCCDECFALDDHGDYPFCLISKDQRGYNFNVIKKRMPTCPLKVHEPQVMSISDLYGYDMGFYERRDEEIVWPVLISRGGPDSDETVGFVRKDGYELRSDCGLMNITWRIWTAYPPHELREATPWL